LWFQKGVTANTCPTASVTGGGAGVHYVREQKKLKARKMPENAAESSPSSARCVERFLAYQHHCF
jgi:hypothetical protein